MIEEYPEKPPTCHRLYHIMLYRVHLTELATLVVIGTDCISSRNSKQIEYHIKCYKLLRICVMGTITTLLSLYIILFVLLFFCYCISLFLTECIDTNPQQLVALYVILDL
jgi:hypothetical protein